MASQSPDPRILNRNAREIVLATAQKMTQPIFTGNVTPANNATLNIPCRNVGLILGFIVVVSGAVTNGAADAATRTGFGSSNAVKSFVYTDLNGTERINTTGYHLALLNTLRQGFGYGGAYAPNLPMGYGNNWSPFEADASLAADAAGTITHTYFVPLAYSAGDLRGGVYANVVNGTQNLQININPTPFVAAGTDPLTAVYSGNANGAWDDTVTVTVYQVYLDQIPMSNGMPVLPLLDLNTIYDLKNTVYTGMAVSQDFPIPYANQRDFLSTLAVFDNGGTFNSGSDVNYWSMVAANSTNLFKLDANTAALLARQWFMADPPPGVYAFDHRDKPINTVSYGNMNLNLNASTVNANAQVIVCTEAFQQANQIPIASSLQV